jgi:hypothetical protein
MKKIISKIILLFSAIPFVFGIVLAFISGSGHSLGKDAYSIFGLFAVSFLFLGIYRIIDLLENKK